MNANFNNNGTWSQLSSLVVGVTPDQYLKSATVAGNNLTLTKQDDTTVSYEPDFSKVSVASTGTAADEVSYITIDGVEKKLAGGSGEPAAYLKSASSSGNTLTLVNKDDSTFAYTPDLSSKQDVISDLSDIREGASKGETAYQKPATGIPSSDMSSAVQTSLGKADTALQEHQSLASYSTTAEMNSAISAHHDSSKQDVISDLATIRSGAALGATALQSVPSTYRTAADQDIIDNGKQDVLTAGTGISLSSNTVANTGVLSVNGNSGAVSGITTNSMFVLNGTELIITMP